MKKLALAALSLAITLPSSAGIIAGGDGGAFIGAPRANAPVQSPFIPHIAQAFAQLGTDRLSQLGVPVLSNLSAIILAGKTADGAAFSRLAEQLDWAGIGGDEFMALSPEQQQLVLAQAGPARISPEDFAKMSPMEKIGALRRAAVLAQAKADAEAAIALSAMPQKLTMKDASELEPRLAKLSADEAYLSPESQQRVGAAVKAIAQFKQARKDAFDAWLKDMPRKIYEGAFDKGGIIAGGEDGWRIAEHSPNDEAYATYEAAFAARKAEIEAMPEGPWKRQAADELVASVRSQAPDLTALGQQASTLRTEIGDFGFATGDKKADAALNTYLSYDATDGRGRKPGRKEAVALLKHYDNLVFGAGLSQHSLQTDWRVKSALLKGDSQSGFRPYQELADVRDAAVKKASDNAFRGLFGYIGAMLSFAAASSLHAPHSVVIGLIVLVFAILAFALKSVWLRNELGSSLGPGREAGRALEDFRASLKS